MPPQDEDAFDRAVAAARDADAAVVVVGMNGEWETEGNDCAAAFLSPISETMTRRRGSSSTSAPPDW